MGKANTYYASLAKANTCDTSQDVSLALRDLAEAVSILTNFPQDRQYHVHNLKNVKNTHGGVLLLIKLQAEACNFTKSNTPPWVFFTFFKFYEWYQIAQRTTYVINRQLKRECVQFLSHGSHYHTFFFLFRLKLKWLKNGGAKIFMVTCIFLKIIAFFKKI